MKKRSVFISSVRREFAELRQRAHDTIHDTIHDKHFSKDSLEEN